MKCERDAESKRVFLTVTGAMGEENEHVVITEVKLLRSVDGGPFKEVEEFEETGDFVYIDTEVDPGSSYSYKFVSTAARDPEAPSNVLDPELETIETDPIGPTPPIPYDFSFRIRRTEDATAESPTPKVVGDFRFWDYEAGEIKSRSRNSFDEKELLGNKRYKIHRIDHAKRTVEVRDGVLAIKEFIKRGDEPFAVELWEPVTPEPVEEEEDDDIVEEPAAAGVDTPAAAPTGTSGGRRSGF